VCFEGVAGVAEDVTVDILLAILNGGEYLREQLRSIQEQTHSNWRVLASDDGSTDDSVSILRDAIRNDQRILEVTDGVSSGSADRHFRRLLTKTDAPYIMFCDQDDVWLPNKVELLLRALRRLEGDVGAETPILVFSDAVVVDAELNTIDHSFMIYSHIDPRRLRLNQLLAQNPVLGCTILMNRALADLLRKTPLACYVRMHDRWSALVASAFGRLHYVDQPTVLYRQHGKNTDGARRFSIRERITIREGIASVGASVAAARSFLEVYGPDMSSEKYQVVHAYSVLGQKAPLARVVSLLRRGMLKGGWARALGQLVCTACLPPMKDR
jgi:glycosyltransferase involved in cell wall biosynthesis